jgi:cell wall assembly regulator SMI1
MESVLERLEAWLWVHQPDVLTDRPAGVSDADLASANAVLGRQLPDDVHAFYRWQNGSPAITLDSGPDMFSPTAVFWYTFVCGRIMPLQEVVEQHRWFCIDRAANRLIDQRHWWWCDEWVSVIANHNGDYVCVDTAGVWGGSIGQLIEYWHADDDRPIISPSLSAWFAARIVDLEEGTVFDESGAFLEYPRWRAPIGYPKTGDIQSPPLTALPTGDLTSGPPDLAERAANSWPLAADAPVRRRLMPSRPRWGQYNGRW